MNPSGPELRDIHLPPPPGWWPPAPGWWLLAVIVLSCGIFALWKMSQIRQRRRACRSVLMELDRCIEAAGADAAALASALSQFLRRLALRDDPNAAALADERWLAWLDAHAGGDEFTRGIGRVLLDAPYRPDASFDAPALIALVRRHTRRVLEARHA